MDKDKQELTALRATLKNAIERIDAILGEDNNKSTTKWNKRCSVLAEVFAKGGVVSSSEFIKIAARYDIKGSGVGGFFASSKSGGGSMIKLGGDRRALTANGEEQIKKWLKEDPNRPEKFGIDPSKLD